MSKLKSISNSTTTLSLSHPLECARSDFLDSESDEPSPLKRSESCFNLFANLSSNKANANNEDEFLTSPPSGSPITPKKDFMTVKAVHFDDRVKVRAVSCSDDDSKTFVADITAFLKADPKSYEPIYAHTISHKNTAAVQAALDALGILNPNNFDLSSLPKSIHSEEDHPLMPTPPAGAGQSPPNENVVGPDDTHDLLECTCTIEMQSLLSVGEIYDDSSLDDCHDSDLTILQCPQSSAQSPASILLAEFMASSHQQESVEVVGHSENPT